MASAEAGALAEMAKANTEIDGPDVHVGDDATAGKLVHAMIPTASAGAGALAEAAKADVDNDKPVGHADDGVDVFSSLFFRSRHREISKSRERSKRPEAPLQHQSAVSADAASHTCCRSAAVNKLS